MTRAVLTLLAIAGLLALLALALPGCSVLGETVDQMNDPYGGGVPSDPADESDGPDRDLRDMNPGAIPDARRLPPHLRARYDEEI